MQLTLSSNKKNELDEELFEYNSIAKSIALEKMTIQTQQEHDENVGGGRSSKISNTTEQTVISFSMSPRIQYLERLRNQIESTYQKLTEEQKKIFDMRWILDEGNDWPVIGEKLHYNKRTIYKKRDKILEKYAKVKGEL